MRVLIFGLPKSGTTILASRVADALDTGIQFEPFTTGQLRQANDARLVTKMLAGPLQWVTVNSGVHFDRVVWIARDPRDVAVSRCLYQFWGGHRKNGRENKVRALIEQKVSAPASVPFHRVYQSITREVDNFIEDDRLRYQQAADQLRRRAGDWFMFHYEDMVSGNLGALSDYLGAEIHTDVAVDKRYERVVRSKGAGEWQDWFTDEDVELFRPIYQPYLDLFPRYDWWQLNPNPVIDRATSLDYIARIRAQGVD